MSSVELGRLPDHCGRRGCGFHGSGSSGAPLCCWLGGGSRSCVVCVSPPTSVSKGFHMGDLAHLPPAPHVSGQKVLNSRPLDPAFHQAGNVRVVHVAQLLFSSSKSSASSRSIVTVSAQLVVSQHSSPLHLPHLQSPLARGDSLQDLGGCSKVSSQGRQISNDGMLLDAVLVVGFRNGNVKEAEAGYAAIVL